jgi:NADPH2:quinone reductase
MRAVWLKEFGPPEVLVPGEAPDPVAAAGQVVVDVEFANITFVETQLRAGRAPFPLPPGALPMIPGNGVGGLVAEVGPGVHETLVGHRVVASTGGRGGYARRVVVDAAHLVEVPSGLALDQAVALLADGRTALALTRAAGVAARERVLVEAAAGGVGSLLVQLAVAAGARVLAAVGGPEKLRLARDLGAEVAVDYRRPDWAATVRAEVGGADVVFDGVGGQAGRAAFELLEPGGRLLSYGMASGEFTRVGDDEARARRVLISRGTAIAPDEATTLTRAALDLAAAGRLTAVIGQRFALESAADAHRAIENRATIGKTLLEVS